MNILAVLGSARRGGNTETLIKEALRGAGRPDADIIELSDYKVYGCQGCKGCKLPDAEGCILMDDMQEIYRRMKEADAILLGSPIYYGEVTGQMKTFMDRWYALKDGSGNLRINKGKKALFIVVQGATVDDWYSHTLERLKKIMAKYGMEPEILVAPGVEQKGEAADHQDLLKKAFMAGARLAAGTKKR
jgi:multimeric flavodoxin WrbA